MNNIQQPTVSRRNFLALGASAVLIHSFDLPFAGKAMAASAPQTVGVWVTIATNGSEIVTIYVDRQEMGQGTMTGLAQAFASEMCAKWGKVRVKMAGASPLTGISHPAPQVTAGSTGMRRSFGPMQKYGAQVREVLLQAARNRVPSTETCSIANGVVTCSDGQSFTFGQLASEAAALPLPTAPSILGGGYVGRSMRRVDIPAKINGSAVFGLDVMQPGQLFAVIKMSPVIGGKLPGSFTPRVPSGCLAAMAVGDNAVAVVANNTWSAWQGVRNLGVNWVNPANASDMDSANIDAVAADLLVNGTAAVAEPPGGSSQAALSAIASSAKRIDATYTLPYLAHACLEPLNCTVKLDESASPPTCEIWAPTQAPGVCVSVVANSVLGSPSSPWPGKVTVHPTFMGGGLGRKYETDFVVQAVRVAKALPPDLAGRPVKLMWPREEDFSHDLYRPMSVCRIKAGLSSYGVVTGWYNRVVQPSIMAAHGWPLTNNLDGTAVDGATNLGYSLGERCVDYVRHPAPVPVGFLRSVGHAINTFAVESAIDELAAKARINPYRFRLNLLTNAPAQAKVLQAAAKLSNWSSPAPAGSARGMALVTGFGSIVAIVAEVSAITTANGQEMKVNRISCAIDCGFAVNPGQVIAQMEGAIIQGISQAFWGQIRFNNGASDVRNYNKYRVVKMRETPLIDVVIVSQGSPLGGVGEPGVPAVAPALANAWAKLTGQRIRSLPMFPASSTMGEL